MSMYCSNCPAFDNYMLGADYPWRGFCYNHTPDFISIVIPPNISEERFTLHVVKNGIYTDILSHIAEDEKINDWISKTSVVCEKEYGEHLNITSAADIRRYVKEYTAYMDLYDSLRQPDLTLEQKAFNLRFFSQMYPSSSPKRQELEAAGDEYMKEHHRQEESLQPLIDALDDLFASKWYKDTPPDDVYQFGYIAEQYHAVAYGILKDLVNDRGAIMAHYIGKFYELVTTAKEDLFVRYYNWNQPDQETLDVLRELLQFTEKILDAENRPG